MRKINSLLKVVPPTVLFAFVVSGCASYRYVYDAKPYKNSYVVSRNDTTIAEYTIGNDDKAPEELRLAKERFKRRKNKVEYYYKKMDVLYTPLGSAVSYPKAIAGAVFGVFKIPFILVREWRYEHNPKYKARIDKIDLDKKVKEDKDREIWRAQLQAYVKQDLEAEAERTSK